MRLIVALGAGILALSGTFILSNNASATEETVVESTIVAKPSQAELRAAINLLESIENYHEYSLLTTQELSATTEFYREYTYVFELAAVANALDANYDLIPAEELSNIIFAAKNAKTTCDYIFGTTRRNHLASNPTPDSANNQTTPTQTQPAPTATSSQKPKTSSQSSTTVASVATTPISYNEPEQPTEKTSTETSESTSDNPNEEDSIAIPATGEATKSNKPFFIAIGIIALACFFIGSMIILNRKKTYHPGRKF